MPVDMPTPKNTVRAAVAAVPVSPLNRSLNWLAVVVSFGLCFWVVQAGLPISF